MSEFKFACPVCGQHITADSHSAGTQLECPTCFRKIVVPQAPTSSDPKFILSAAEANKPRRFHRTAAASGVGGRRSSGSRLVPVAVGIVVFIGVAGAATYVFHDRIFGRSDVPRSGDHATTEPPLKHGSIGLSSWSTQVEYSNVVVSLNGQSIYQSDFKGGASGWLTIHGTWLTTNGVFRQLSTSTDCRAVTGDSSWGNYTLSVKARKLGGREGFLILFNVVDGQNWTWWNLGGWGNTQHAIENSVASRKSTIGGPVAGRIDTGRWYDIRIELDGARIRCYLDGRLIHDVTYPPPSSGSVAMRS